MNDEKKQTVASPIEPVVMLPDGLLEEGLELSRGAVVFGVNLDDMSKEQLKAVAALGWRAFDQSTVSRPTDLV